jgi:hypothetical protein
MLEMILDRENMKEAYKRVVANKGSHGVDGMEVYELLPYLKETLNHKATITGREI